MTLDHSTLDHVTLDHVTLDHVTLDHVTLDHSTLDHSTLIIAESFSNIQSRRYYEDYKSGDYSGWG